MTVWLAAFALGTIAAALLPLVIFCASYGLISVFALFVIWLIGQASLHIVVALFIGLVALQVGYGFGFAVLAALKISKIWAGDHKADLEDTRRQLQRGTFRERLDRRWHNR